MGEVVNLRLARKAKVRSAKDATADQNRATFGQPKHIRKTNEAHKLNENRKLDGHRLPDRSDDV